MGKFVPPPGALLCKNTIKHISIEIQFEKNDVAKHFVFTKTLIPWHFDTTSYTIRQQSNAIDMRPAIASRPKVCKLVQRDKDVKRLESTGSASITLNAAFSICRCNNCV